MTELQQQILQVCENNWVRKIAGVKRADRRRMVELMEETEVQRSLTERLVRSRQEKNGGVNGRGRSTEELDRETGEEQTGEEWWS